MTINTSINCTKDEERISSSVKKRQLEEETDRNVPTMVSAKTPNPSLTGLEEFLSPEKLARISMLKLRFADTIYKAQQTLFPNTAAAKSRPKSASVATKLETQERGALGVKKRQEAKIAPVKANPPAERCQEARVDLRKVAGPRKVDPPPENKRLREDNYRRIEASARKRSGPGIDDLRMRRKEIASKREKARIEADKIKLTVDLDNLGVLGELERLIGRPCVYHEDWFYRYQPD